MQPGKHVPAGFQSLPARWKVPGKKLEVLFPSQEIPDGDKPLKREKCTLKVTMQSFHLPAGEDRKADSGVAGRLLQEAIAADVPERALRRHCRSVRSGQL